MDLIISFRKLEQCPIALISHLCDDLRYGFSDILQASTSQFHPILSVKLAPHRTSNCSPLLLGFYQYFHNRGLNTKSSITRNRGRVRHGNQGELFSYPGQ
jgi:hypothetical protein